MKLEEQVCSLELAKKLKELGVKQESLWYWDEGHNGELELTQQISRFNHCSAFTVAELGEMLPWRVVANDRDFRLREYKAASSFWQVCYFDLDRNMMHDEFDDYHANARAKILIWLIENKYVDIKQEV